MVLVGFEFDEGADLTSDVGGLTVVVKSLEVGMGD